MPHDEDEIVLGVLARLRALGCVAWHVDAGSKKLRAKLIAMGVPKRVVAMLPVIGGKGMPDILGCTPAGRALMLEVKRPAVIRDLPGGGFEVVRAAGAPSPEQLAALDAAWQRDAACGVTWGHSDVDHVIRPWPLGGV